MATRNGNKDNQEQSSSSSSAAAAATSRGRNAVAGDAGDAGGDDGQGDVALLAGVIGQLQQSIDAMVAALGPAPVRSLMLPSTAASDLKPEHIIAQVSHPFASPQHQAIARSTCLQLLLDRLHTFAYFTLTDCKQRIQGAVEQHGSLVSPPACTVPRSGLKLTNSALWELRQFCLALTEFVTKLLATQSELQVQAGELALARESKQEEVKMMQHILANTNPATGAPASSAEANAKHKQTWESLFDKISLAAEHRARALDANETSSSSSSGNAKHVGVQTHAREFDAETGEEVDVMDQAASAPPLAVTIMEDAVHNLLNDALTLDIESVLPPETLRIFRSRLASLPPVSTRATHATLAFIASLLKGCRAAFDDLNAKTVRAYKERDAAVHHANQTDKLVKDTEVRLQSEYEKRMDAARAQATADRHKTIEEYTQKLEEADGAAASLRETITFLETEVNRLKAELSDARKQATKMSTKLQAKEHLLNEMREDMQEVNTYKHDLHQAKQQAKSLEEQLFQRDEQVALLTRQLTDATTARDAAETKRVQDIQSMQEEHENEVNALNQAHTDRQRKLTEEAAKAWQELETKQDKEEQLLAHTRELEDKVAQLEQQLQCREEEQAASRLVAEKQTQLMREAAKVPALRQANMQLEEQLQQLQEQLQSLHEKAARRTPPPKPQSPPQPTPQPKKKEEPYKVTEPTPMWLENFDTDVSFEADMRSPIPQQSSHHNHHHQAPSLSRQQTPAKDSARVRTAGSSSSSSRRPPSRERPDPISSEEAYMRIMRKYKQGSGGGRKKGTSPRSRPSTEMKGRKQSAQPRARAQAGGHEAALSPSQRSGGSGGGGGDGRSGDGRSGLVPRPPSSQRARGSGVRSEAGLLSSKFAGRYLQ